MPGSGRQGTPSSNALKGTSSCVVLGTGGLTPSPPSGTLTPCEPKGLADAEGAVSAQGGGAVGGWVGNDGPALRVGPGAADVCGDAVAKGLRRSGDRARL